MPDNANSFNLACDWRFGLNLSPKQRGTVGYLLSWSGAGGLSLQKDLEVWNPFSGAGQTVISGATVKCVGLLESFEYEGGEDDPIKLVAYVSKTAAAAVRAKLARPLPSTKVQLAWYVISYDEDRKSWYEATVIKPPGKVEAVIDTADGEIQWFIDARGEAIAAALDIKVFRMEMQIVPAPGKTAVLEFATGQAERLVKQWAG